MDHEAYKEMIALDALGLLEAAERRELDAHLATCADCRAELREARDAAAMLAFAFQPVAPPDALRARILEDIKNQKQLPRAETTNGESAASSDQPATNAAIESNVVPFVSRRGDSNKQPLLTFGLIAASLMIVTLLVGLYALWQRNKDMQAEVAREREVRELLTEPDARIISLEGTATAPGAGGRLIISRSEGRAALFAHDLPPAPQGKAYQLWFIAAGRQPAPGGVFTTDNAGRASLRDTIPNEVRRDAATFAVTLENSSGETSPKGEKYLLGSL